MKITVAQWDLADVLQKLQSITPHRPQQAILKNVLLNATDEGLYCTATDLEISLRVLIEGLLDEPGQITVDCKRLATLIKTLDSDQVELNATSNDRLRIKSGKGKYTFGGLSADEFLKISTETEKNFSIPAGNLRTALIDTDFAAATEEVRYFLNGVAFTFKDNKIEFAATDAAQVALSVYHSKDINEMPQVVIPLKACQGIKKTFTEDKDISVSVNESNLTLFTDTHQFSTRTVDLAGNTFPNYWRFIDFEKADAVVVNKDQLEKAIQRISLFSQTTNYGIQLAINEDALNVSANTIGEISSVEYEGSEPVEISSKTSEFEFMVNSKMLSNILSRFHCEEIVITTAESKDRISIQCPDNDDQSYTLGLLKPDA